MLNNYTVNIQPYVVPPSVMYQQEKQEIKPYEQKPQNADSFQQNKDQSRQQNFQTVNYNSTKINIGQVLTDFQNTLKAIAAPQEVEEEIQGYLKLIEIQSKKENPSIDIIKLNLRTASKILDTYISETLQKPSKVVEEWINALLLQQIDFKHDPEKAELSAAEQIINGQKQDEEEKQEQKQDEEPKENQKENSKAVNIFEKATSQEPFLPKDKNLRQLYMNAKIYTQQKDYQNALKTYKSSLQLAQKLNDTEAQAYIYNNVGDIFNKQNNLPKALRCYQESINSTDDIGLKSKSHHKLGNLYNELNKFDPSMEHYFESLAFKGELEDIKNQSKILENIGEMHAKKYSSREAISYFKLGVDLAKETKDTKRMSSIFSKTAQTFKQTGKSDKAAKYYQKAIELDKSSNYKMYREAGDLMMDMNYSQKAKSLYKKGMQIALEKKDLKEANAIKEKLMNL